jgi:hypothetical protein
VKNLPRLLKGNKMAKFIKDDVLDKKEIEPKTETKKQEKHIYITKGKQTFVICPKCGWMHEKDTKVCRFCYSKV